MNIFKNLMFLQGHFTDPHMDDDFGPKYGHPTALIRTLDAAADEDARHAGDNDADAGDSRRTERPQARACG